MQTKLLPLAALPVLAAVVVALTFAAPAHAQVRTEVPPVVPGAKPVTVERILIHGAALEGNLEGNAAARDVIVYLPPSYRTAPDRRYPVVYALHGYSVGAEQWSREIQAPQSIEGAFGLGANEMIVVVPDSKTLHNGSMYSSSVTTGDFERYIARDVVEYVDSHYRTIPARESRGLVGHSMGGYGATRIGMKHADVFGSLYIMSPCCLSPRGARRISQEHATALDAVRTAADVARLPGALRSLLAGAAAWSPNPQKAPLFVDLPFGDSATEAGVLARWAANAPLTFLDQYIGNLRRYNGIAIDVGDRDGLLADAERLHAALDRYALPHTFEVYSGTHTSGMGVRFQNNVMPFFSERLCTRDRCD